jgi:hypothetical protein
VFLARERSLDRAVVIKLLPPELATAVSAQRFHREAGGARRGTRADVCSASDAVRWRARTRPLCAYPRLTRYRGTGSTDEERNFECVVPASRGQPTVLR